MTVWRPILYLVHAEYCRMILFVNSCKWMFTRTMFVSLNIAKDSDFLLVRHIFYWSDTFFTIHGLRTGDFPIDCMLLLCVEMTTCIICLCLYFLYYRIYYCVELTIHLSYAPLTQILWTWRTCVRWMVRNWNITHTYRKLNCFIPW